jgi:hypothetical protein
MALPFEVINARIELHGHVGWPGVSLGAPRE